MTLEKRLVRSRTNKMIGGVCGGLGEYFDFDPTLIRLLFAALIVFGAGSPILLYLLMWIIIPGADSPRAMIGVNDKAMAVEAPETHVSQPVTDAEPVPAGDSAAAASTETDEPSLQTG
jgi:phage shock protein C